MTGASYTDAMRQDLLRCIADWEPAIEAGHLSHSDRSEIREQAVEQLVTVIGGGLDRAISRMEAFRLVSS